MTRLYSTLAVLLFFMIHLNGQSTPICKSVTVSLSDNGEATVSAETFLNIDEGCCPVGSVDYEIRLSGGIYAPDLTVTCNELGQRLIEIRSVDCLGFIHKCQTSVITQDNLDGCNNNCPNCCYPIVLTQSMMVGIS